MAKTGMKLNAVREREAQYRKKGVPLDRLSSKGAAMRVDKDELTKLLDEIEGRRLQDNP